MRVIDFGYVPYLRSQACYHAVAEMMRPEDPDTLTLVNPQEPYVCVGYHQEVDKEIDLDYCTAHAIPVVRRQVGGGAVYLDRDQMFWHYIVHRSRAPYRVEELYERFLRAPVSALRTLGIPAVHRPVNDIQVDGRKIGGTGAASIGDAVVIVGSMILDFNYRLMARVLKVPSEKFRDKVYQTLETYLTTMRRELGERAPDRDRQKAVLLTETESALGVRVLPGDLTPREQAHLPVVERRLASPGWTYRKSGLRTQGLKIAEGVRVVEGAYKAPGGLIRATAVVREDRIDDVSLSGDFFFYPPDDLSRLEAALRGAPFHERALAERIEDFFHRRSVQVPSVSPADFAQAVVGAPNMPPSMPPS